MKKLLEMNEQDMGQYRNGLRALGALVATGLAFIISPIDVELLDLDELGERKGKYEPRVLFDNENVSIEQSLFSGRDLHDYVSSGITKDLPRVADSDSIGARWLIDKTEPERDCKVLLLHFLSRDEYFSVAKVGDGRFNVTALNENETIKSEVKAGDKKVVDILLNSDSKLRVLYETSSGRQDDYMQQDVYGKYTVVR